MKYFETNHNHLRFDSNFGENSVIIRKYNYSTCLTEFAINFAAEKKWKFQPEDMLITFEVYVIVNLNYAYNYSKGIKSVKRSI